MNFTFSHGRCSVKCTNGLCQVQLNSKKRIPKHGELNAKSENLYSHLQTLKLNPEHVKEFFPEYFSSGNDFDDAAGPMPEDLNTEDQKCCINKGRRDIHIETISAKFRWQFEDV